VIAWRLEITGSASSVIDVEDRDPQQAQLATRPRPLEMKDENRGIHPPKHASKDMPAQFLLMDLELSSREIPLEQDVSGSVAIIHPNDHCSPSNAGGRDVLRSPSTSSRSGT
jgi:hypothetical protein